MALARKPSNPEWKHIKDLASRGSDATQASDLGISQSWEVIDASETNLKEESKIDPDLLSKFENVQTILSDSSLRQILIDDLEELESFLKQRQAELTQKDQGNFIFAGQDTFTSKSIPSGKEDEFERLKTELSNKECNANIQKIVNVLRELYDARFVCTLEIKQEPERTLGRLTRQIGDPLMLKQRQLEAIKAISERSKVLEAEIQTYSGQIVALEEQLNEVVAELEREIGQ